MADSVSVTTKSSYGDRVGRSFQRIVGGIVLVIGSIALLGWNEHNFIEQKKALNETSKLVQETSPEKIDASLEGQVVHFHGQTSSPAQALQDPVFGITTEDLKLERKVEMYQWTESSSESCREDGAGGEECTKTYTYKKEWKDDVVDSDTFHESIGHTNPSSMEYEYQERTKSPIQIQAFTLGEKLVEKLTNYQELPLAEQTITFPDQSTPAAETTLNESNDLANDSGTNLSGESLATGENGEQASGESLSGTQEQNSGENKPDRQPSVAQRFHIIGNTIYVGKDPQNPKVGDLKITFVTVKPEITSIVGQQNGDEVGEYVTSNGREIALLEKGTRTAEQMFAHAHQSNRNFTRILRFVGIFLMYMGFSMMLEFLSTLFKFVPFLANIVGVGTGIAALALTVSIGMTTIAITWLAVRPIIGISLLLLGIGGAIFLTQKKATKKEGHSNPTK